ncbi:MAG: ankyrin repeat domain-containing protein [Planctomycetota bacterium]|nr:ankyrin repeat domain-containing protein [Planctomycetota bacterium]
MPEPDRHVPVRPDLAQLEREAADLLQRFNADEEAAVNEVFKHHPDLIPPGKGRIDQVRLALARSYGVADWERLALACRLIDAIWRDDAEAVRAMVEARPALLHENARATEHCNWGPPMSYAANLGRDAIIKMLHGLGAKDLQHALDRATLQSRISTARMLREMGAPIPAGAVMGPCETLSGPGLAFALELGAPLADAQGDRLAPIGLILETYCRNPKGKHACLEIVAAHGVALPDTAAMAVHRGRQDLLEAVLQRDPGALNRRLSHRDIYPLELGCHEDESLALCGTSPAGGTLLHLCVDDDEIDLARWLIERGADVNARATVDADGFGGHTPLFGCVVSQAWRCGRQRDGAFARLLLDHGADTKVVTSLRKRLRFVKDETMHEYRDVSPRTWGERFHDQDWVNQTVMKMLA